MQTNNKLREACANIAEYARSAMCHATDTHVLGYLNQIERWANAALAAPPRNCDSYDSADEMMKECADDAFLEEWKEWRETGKCHPLMIDAFLCINWLFLTNEKGETNGSK